MRFKKQLAFFYQWFDERTFRERVLILFLGWAFIYLTWNLFFLRPLILEQNAIASDVSSVKNQIAIFHKQTEDILTVASQNSMDAKMQEQQRLLSQTETLQQRIAGLMSSVIQADMIPSILKDVLKQQEGVTALSMKNLTEEPLVSASDKKDDLPQQTQNINRNNMVILFKGNYFSTLSLLKRLETLRWRLYWEGLDYRVENYPEASVQVKFYVLTHQKS